jgi:hypothetical protein
MSKEYPFVYRGHGTAYNSGAMGLYIWLAKPVNSPEAVSAEGDTFY